MHFPFRLDLEEHSALAAQNKLKASEIEGFSGNAQMVEAVKDQWVQLLCYSFLAAFVWHVCHWLNSEAHADAMLQCCDENLKTFWKSLKNV